MSLWFNVAAGNIAPDSRSLTLSPSRNGEEKWTKGEICGLRKRQFHVTTKEILTLILILLLILLIIILIIIIIITIMSMQTKLHTIKFLSPPDDQFPARPGVEIMKPGNHKFHRFHETPDKD